MNSRIPYCPPPAWQELALNWPKDEMALLKAELAATGFMQLTTAIAKERLSALREESGSRFVGALAASGNRTLPYRSRLAGLGPVAMSFLTGNAMANLLVMFFGQPHKLCPQSSCYTYYREGDFLAAHRDNAEGCKVTVLIYLRADAPLPGRADSGLFLELYQDNRGQPGSLLRRLETTQGTIVAGLGSQVWHARKMLLPGERVDMLTACFVPTL